MKVDLHVHSNASDGQLSPSQLIELAVSENVDMLSITDHDTLSAYRAISPPASLELVPGIEFSTRWRQFGVHVVGLNVDLDCPAMTEAVERQQSARRRRAECIAKRLHAAGVAVDFENVSARAGGESVGRPHFAAELVATGVVKDLRTAFRKYLGAGKPGDVRTDWPDIEEVAGWIASAGGSAVLAHPAKYRLTWTRLGQLLDDFCDAGGDALEVVCGQQTDQLTKRLVGLARDRQLAASLGSDFHSPAPWCRPGIRSDLTDDLTPVWEAWRTS